MTFLNIYRKYECLWDPTCEDYLKRDVKDAAYVSMIDELNVAGLEVKEAPLKKKIKVLRDSYRNELNKIKKSKNNGAGVDELYKPKLMWFSTADAFLRNVISGRETISNLVCIHKYLKEFNFLYYINRTVYFCVDYHLKENIISES